MMNPIQVEQALDRAVRVLVERCGMPSDDLDQRVASMWRSWLGEDLPWSEDGLTADDFFFLSTLCGTMTMDGQRTHMRRFFPAFVQEVGRDIRRFTQSILHSWRLRSPWMKTRLLRMGSVLTARDQDMTAYANNLRRLEGAATSANPMPALHAIVKDHGGGGRKTLSIFVRDCVLGNSFPIDTRVANVLDEFDLPHEELPLVTAALSLGHNPRSLARLFYDAGGEGSFFVGGE